MLTYIAGRVLQGVFVLWAAFTLTFIVLFTLPGDPVQIMLNPGGGTYVPEATIAATREQYGFDRPLLSQYGSRLLAAIGGDFGNSVQQRLPVSELISKSLPSTISLTIAALSLALVVGLLLAISAHYLHGAPRAILLALPGIGISIPVFWTGLVLIQVVSFRWNLLPAIGGTGFSSLILPAITLAIPSAAIVAQIFFESLESTSRQAYIMTARTKGAAEGRVLTRHITRPALLPLLPMVAILLGNLIGGAVVVETVFSRNGIGRLVADAVTRHDIPVVLGVVSLSALVFVITSLIADLAAMWIDPRIRVATTGDGL